MRQNTAATPIHTDIILIGGGHSHVKVLKDFGMFPVSGVRLTLVTPGALTPYSGMLPGLIAGHYTREDCYIDLVKLARFAGARLIFAEACGLDRANRRVLLKDRAPIAYDYVSINVGSAPDWAGISGAEEHVIPVKPIARFLERWRSLRQAVLSADGPRRIAVVGGGAGGVELLLCAQHRLTRDMAGRGLDPDALSFTLLTREGLLPTHNSRVRKIFARILKERNVRLESDFQAAAITKDAVISAAGRAVPADAVLLVTQAGAPAWFSQTGLSLDERGFLLVGPQLHSLYDECVFAAGDCASMAHAPREKSGVFAVRQGPPLAGNLRRAAAGRKLKAFYPQRRFLSLISTGDKRAVASWGGFFAVEGDWVWRWKDWIDRRWMSRYQDLPAMTEPAGIPDHGGEPNPSAGGPAAFAATAMRCGGCGAKIGPTILSRVLERIAARRIDGSAVILGLEARDDAAVLKAPDGALLVESVDFFRALVDDPWIFGQIAANHAVNDLYAMNARPLAALALAAVPYGPPAKVEETLFQLLDGAAAQLAQDAIPLAGGHSSEAAELGLGFAVTGTAEPDKLMRKGGLKPGDGLILTRPIGTGVLFAGEMRGLAEGEWIAAALAHMRRSNRKVAGVLHAHGATACTDVSGFGLAGHLAEMLRASKAAASLNLDAIPLYEGALELAAQGVASSLLPQNVLLKDGLFAEQSSRDARIPLLFDPQTAGGLLAGIPAASLDACLSQLAALGEKAALIGYVEPWKDSRQPLIRLDNNTSRHNE